MVEATPELLALVGEEGAAEPYRYLMKKPAFSPDGDTGMAGSAPERRRTAKTRRPADTKRRTVGTALRLLPVTSGVWHGIIANGDLLDTLRRVKCFGVPLVRIDIRQESTRHTEALGDKRPATSVSATTKAGQRPTNRRS